MLVGSSFQIKNVDTWCVWNSNNSASHGGAKLLDGGTTLLEDGDYGFDGPCFVMPCRALACPGVAKLPWRALALPKCPLAKTPWRAVPADGTSFGTLATPSLHPFKDHRLSSEFVRVPSRGFFSAQDRFRLDAPIIEDPRGVPDA
jgi:hypothetical protein